MKKKEIKSLTKDQSLREINKLKKDLFNMRFKKVNGQLQNISEYSNMKLEEIINLSLNETFNRTIITSITTLFVVVSLFIFGGGSLRGLSFGLIIGVLSGTYSSIFVATPVMMFLRNKYYEEEIEGDL